MSRHRIVFMGTPPFAVAMLDALVSAGHDVAAVVTAPDKPAGRGRQPRASAVKQRALELGLPVLQPERLRDPEFLEQLDATGASIYVVVAFRMLPEVVWRLPLLGTINLHASLLPNYRGAAPINWAVINGERTSGLTTFLIGADIDTGDILLQEEMTIGTDETAGELHDRMMVQGAGLILRTVDGLIAGQLRPVPQRSQGTLHAAPKIGPADCRLDPTLPRRQVHDRVRGMSPIPGAWCEWVEAGKSPIHFKVLRTTIPIDTDGAAEGSIRITDGRLLMACADGWLEAQEVQPEGRKRMTAGEFVRGLRSTGPYHFQ